MRNHYLTQSKTENLVHGGLIIATMFLILLLIGWFVAGGIGILAAFIMGLMLAISATFISSQLILNMYGAQRLSPYQAPGLYELISELSARAGLQSVPKIHYLPSRVLNAFATGRGADSAIAVSDGLLRTLNARELGAVLAHEISHLKHNDLWVMNMADILSRLTTLMAMLGYFLILIYLPIYVFTDATIPWLVLLTLLAAPHISALLQLALSRNREYGADLYAAELTGDPMALASALQKIDLYQGRWMERVLFPNRKVPDPSLLRTHPKLRDRIERLKAIAQAQYYERHLEVPIDLGWHPQGPLVRPPRRRLHGLWY
jgi:heat shock protein HtpX